MTYSSYYSKKFLLGLTISGSTHFLPNFVDVSAFSIFCFILTNAYIIHLPTSVQKNTVHIACIVHIIYQYLDYPAFIRNVNHKIVVCHAVVQNSFQQTLSNQLLYHYLNTQNLVTLVKRGAGEKRLHFEYL